MKVSIIGSGYVGLVTAACLAELGNHVICCDIDSAKVELLNNGGVPIYEHGLSEMIASNRHAGRITFTTNAAHAVTFGDILFIAVGTPPGPDGNADLRYVLDAARSIGKYADRFKVVVDKSTVPVGTGEEVKAVISEEMTKRGRVFEYSVISNPEFLKEGVAIDDFMRPDRIIIGHDNDALGLRAVELMKSLYAPFNRNHQRTYFMSVRSAEFTKYAANSMLAARISFMNELAGLAECVGADIESVREGIGSDPRIGFSFLYAGAGYGGSCFPKDVLALERIGRANEKHMHILKAVQTVNSSQKRVLVDKVCKEFGADLSGKKFAIWGLAFKPGTDDMREAPSRVVIKELIDRGAEVVAYDPVAMDAAYESLKGDLASDNFQRLAFGNDPMSILDGANGLLIITEWKQFKSPDFASIKERLEDAIIFDGRNLFIPAAVESYGIRYRAIGRGINHG